MAQINKQDILLGMRSIGSVSVDNGAIRGGGGSIRPQLIVPLTIQMNPMHDQDAMLAVCWLGANLFTDQNASLDMTICQPISQQLMTRFPARSQQKIPMDHTEPLRFFLSPAEVEDVEQRRHATKSDIFTLYLGLEVMVAGVETFNSVESGLTPGKTRWEMQYGIYSQVFPFWTTQVSPVMVQIEQSRWVNNVLPGLGYDRSRLIEMKFPPPLPGHQSAAAQFDKAKQALDGRRYGDCILACRGLLNMWETQYGADRKIHIGKLIADERQWPENDIRRKLLDKLWEQVGDVANAPAHPEGNVNSELFDGRDARLLLLLTAALSEYVEAR